MTSPLNLKPGMFVVVVEDTQIEDCYNEFFGGRSVKPMYSGYPCKVVEVSIPFICVTDGEDVWAIDSRRMKVQRVHRKYVKAMEARKCIGHQPEDTFVQKTLVKIKQKKQKPDSRACPRCGTRMVQRRAGEGKWVLFCRSCGYSGGQLVVDG